MPAQFVRQLAAFDDNAGSGATETITLTASATAGNTVILGAGTRIAAASGGTTVADSRGNTWTVAIQAGTTTTNDNVLIAFTEQNVAPLKAGDTVTITYGTAPSHVHRFSWLIEFSGLNGLDVTTSNETGTSTTTPVTGTTGTLATTRSMVFAMITSDADNAYTANAGFQSFPTKEMGEPGFKSSSGLYGLYGGTTAGVQAGWTQSISVPYTAAIAVFKVKPEISVVGSWEGRNQAGNSAAISVSGVAKGDMLVVVTSTFETTGSASPIAPTDDVGSVYTQRTATVADGTYRSAVAIHDTVVQAAIPTTVTINGAVGVDDIGGAVLLVRGQASSPFDQGTALEVTGANPTTTAILPTKPGSLLVAALTHAGTQSTIDFAAGWTENQEDEDATNGVPYSVVSKVLPGLLSTSHQWTVISKPHSVVMVSYWPDLPFPETPIIDDFNRASLGGNWTNDPFAWGSASFSIVSNEISGTIEPMAAFLGAGPCDSNWELYATIRSLPTVTGDVGLMVYLHAGGTLGGGASSAVNDGYYVLHEVNTAGADFVRIGRQDNGAGTILGSVLQEVAVGDQLGIRKQGTVITSYLNGIPLLSVVDATYSGYGYPMLYAFGTGTMAADNLGGGPVLRPLVLPKPQTRRGVAQRRAV